MANAIIQQSPEQQPAITPFAFESQALRTMTDKSGNPWFIAKDVCSCLGISDTSQAVARLHKNEKGTTFTHTLGGIQELSTVNEPGLYRLIFRSNKPEAEAFQNWVYHEVLPSIRKTGSYGHGISPTELNARIDASAKAAVANEIRRLGTPQKKRKPQHSVNPTPEMIAAVSLYTTNRDIVTNAEVCKHLNQPSNKALQMTVASALKKLGFYAGRVDLDNAKRRRVWVRPGGAA